MREPKIEAHRVTKPIQLLAAWLVGLIAVDGAFLTGAAMIEAPAWIAGALVIAAIVNVPLFLIALFVLQTRYRPEMQEDTFYSKYLDSQSARVSVEGVSAEVATIRADLSESTQRTLALVDGLQGQIAGISQSLQHAAQIRGPESGAVPNVNELERMISASTEAIANTRQLAGWERYKISLNDLLPEHERIQAALEEASIRVDARFGSTSAQPERPRKKILSFGPKVGMDHVRAMYELLAPFGFDHLSYSDREMSTGQIYIGSYIYRSNPSAPKVVTNELNSLLADPETSIDTLISVLEA